MVLHRPDEDGGRNISGARIVSQSGVLAVVSTRPSDLASQAACFDGVDVRPGDLDGRLKGCSLY